LKRRASAAGIRWWRSKRQSSEISIRKMRANIPLEGLSSEELLEDWAWLLGKTFTLIALNNFADMFLRNEAGEIYFLSLATGELNELAKSSAEFQRLSADKVNQEKLFSLKLLTELERAGLKIASGQCFGFKKPPSLGGEIEVSNIEISPLNPYVSLMGQIHQQVSKLPPSTKITGVKIE
jgi:hypothetical protein